ncbi:unnamed protein product [Parascedosporium putredinis]|uniref:Store-operated calcium entry-associated regulatory factor n=1 Tax=Parascedosporium putredinis TaxID=1442378 RepID=A0A9P1MBS0_9PEZI|nr:unnamed protein product [Parascedosporium putredinis]CAI8000108.1 unnamed protein product [Parascedosporium putredinis]
MPVPVELCLRRRAMLAMTTAAATAPSRRVHAIRGVALRQISGSAARLEMARRPPPQHHRTATATATATATGRSWDAKTLNAPRSRRKERTLALFKSVVGGTTEEGLGGEAVDRAAQRVTEVAFLMRAGQMTAEQAWTAVKEEILPALGDPDKIYAELATGLRGVLEAILEARSEGLEDKALPTGKEVAEVYLDYGKARNLRPLLRLVRATLEHAVQAESTALLPAVEEVVGLWTVIFSERQAARRDVVKVPSLKSPKVQRLLWVPDAFGAVVRSLVARAPAVEAAGIPALLLTTFTLVEKAGLCESETIKPIAPLLELLENVMASVWMNPKEEALLEFRGQSDKLRAYVASNIDLLLQRTTAIALTPAQFHRRLSRAFRVRNLDQIRRIWDELAAQILESRVQPGTEEHKKFADPLNFCVFIWCALGQDDIDTVLGFMNQNGFDLTLVTNIGLLWDKLVKDGTPLDAVIWSARISALMACGFEKPALRALHEMGQAWDAAVKSGHAGDAVRPEIGPVNAALSGILRSKGVKAAPAVLSWAAKYEVEPDIITYNMLLKAMLKEGLAEETGGLLREMNGRGIAADAATFTIIVEEALSAAVGKTEEEQLAAVQAIFAAIEASRQKPKLATYAKMIHVLLDPPAHHPSHGHQPGSGAGEAVKAVLEHMEHHGVLPSSHIFTIVAEHHFSRGNAEAVRAMIESWHLEAAPAETSGKVDRVFWEVVIRGYARAGLAQEAKEVFFRMGNNVRRVALGVLDQLLVALLDEGDVAGARDLVASVKERKAGMDAEEWGMMRAIGSLSYPSLLLQDDAPPGLRHPAAEMRLPAAICALHRIDVMRCTNQGSSYSDEDIQWSCKAELPQELRLGSTEVICEGYDSPDDPYVLKGSCGVEYRLVLTEKGEVRYPDITNSWSSSQSEWNTGSYVFIAIFVAVLAWILYSAFFAARDVRRGANYPGRGAGGGFWPGGGGGGDGPGGWGPGWGPGGDHDPPPPYPGHKPAAPGSAGQGWQPGFWSGLAGGLPRPI